MDRGRPEAEIAAGLVLKGGSGTDAQVLAGINWAVGTGADVVSMSLGGLTLAPDIPSTYTAAIVTCLRAGIPVVTAIGNEGEQTSGSPGNDLFAFAIGATDHRDLPAGFSGGRTQVIQESAFIPPDALPLPYSKPDVSAPGVAVVSAVPGGSGPPSTAPRWPPRTSRGRSPCCSRRPRSAASSRGPSGPS